MNRGNATTVLCLRLPLSTVVRECKTLQPREKDPLSRTKDVKRAKKSCTIISLILLTCSVPGVRGVRDGGQHPAAAGDGPHQEQGLHQRPSLLHEGAYHTLNLVKNITLFTFA